MPSRVIHGLRDLLWRSIGKASRRPEPDGALRASEERLRTALFAGRTVAWEWDLRTDTVVRSDNAPSLLGLPVTNAAERGETFATFLHPDDRDRVRAAMRAALETKSAVAVQFRLLRPDGTVLWILDDGRFELDETGRPMRMRGILRDITEQKEAEERLAFVADHAPVLIAQIDERHGYVFANRPYAGHYGRRPEDIVGRHVRDIVGQRVYGELEPRLQACLAERREVTWESAEESRHFQFRAAVARDERGRPRSVLLVATDITKRKLAEDELEQAKREAEAANRAKDEFLALLSHELRTPMNAVYGWARMLQSGQLGSATVPRAVEVIVRNAHAQLQLIDDLLDVSRIVTGKMRLELRSVELTKVAEAALDAVRPAAEAKAIRLRAVFDPRVPALHADPDRLQQVVWNLLMNGVKFTPSGGRVEVLVQRVDEQVEITVRDSGQGIPSAALPFIFDRFRQADSSSTRATTGLGIGLALVRHLVELHGGTVDAHSDGEGKGATFHVRLPITAPPAVAASSRGHVAALPRPSAYGPSLEGLRILVVDDDRDGGELVSHILRSAGAETLCCTSAPDALAAMAPWRPDILISDIEMPGEDGFSLIRKTRALGDDNGGAVPAIALTAYGRPEDRVRALSAGYSMHVPKPVEPAELVAIVANLAGRS
jgi:PAS domain S-box-containing protein